jgi:hypothetical protein
MPHGSAATRHMIGHSACAAPLSLTPGTSTPMQWRGTKLEFLLSNCLVVAGDRPIEPHACSGRQCRAVSLPLHVSVTTTCATIVLMCWRPTGRAVRPASHWHVSNVSKGCGSRSTRRLLHSIVVKSAHSVGLACQKTSAMRLCATLVATLARRSSGRCLQRRRPCGSVLRF